MKVALFTDADVFAGTERHILDLAVAFAVEALNVCIISPPGSALEAHAAKEGISHVALPKRSDFDARAVWELCNWLCSGQIDLLHAHNGRTALLAAVAVRIAGRGTLVVSQHFLLPAHASRGRLGRTIASVAHRWVYRTAAAGVAVSQAVRAAWVKRGQIAAAKVHVIPNGLRVPPDGDDGLGAAAPAELGIHVEEPLILCVGRLEPEKDVATLISAMVLVRQRHPRARCVVVGDGSERRTLEQQTEQLGLEETVRLVGFRDDAARCIEGCSLLVLTSLHESFGLVLLEAMARSKPVIATRAGGPEEVVVSGETGLLVAPRDPEALAVAISNLLDAPERLRAMGVAGRARFLERFTAERMARDTLALYREIVPK